MNFMLYNSILLVSGTFYMFLFSVVLMASIMPFTALANTPEPVKKISSFLIMLVAMVAQIYLWCLWAAFCASLTLFYTQKPEVTWGWMYWVGGFFWSSAIIGVFFNKERQTTNSASELRSIMAGASAYTIVTVAAYCIFGLHPSFMMNVYGWIIAPLGLLPTTPS